MIATLNLGPTDPNNPKEDFTQHFGPARNTAFKDDVKKFVDYLHSRYDGDKFFRVLDCLKNETDCLAECRKIEWLNKRPPIPEQLASLASFATRFEEARVVLDYYNKNGWSLGIYTDNAFGGLHYDERSNPVTDKSRDTIYQMFGKIHEGACRLIEGLFYVRAEVVTDESENEFTGIPYIVSPPFASKPEAENYLKLMNESYDDLEKTELVKEFLPPKVSIDYVSKGRVICP